MRNIITIFLFSTALFVSCTSQNSAASASNDASYGSSFEKAIKVNSVPEEYQYLKKNCGGCQMKSQALVPNKKKYYDILTVINKDGSEQQYYFDITSFFGKGF